MAGGGEQHDQCDLYQEIGLQVVQGLREFHQIQDHQGYHLLHFLHSIRVDLAGLCYQVDQEDLEGHVLPSQEQEKMRHEL